MYDLEQQQTVRKPARKAQRRALPPACGVCGGKPWIAINSYSQVVAGLPSFDRCQRERGQYFRAADKKRAGQTV